MLLLRCYTTIEASRFRNKVKKVILAEANVEMFNILGYAITFKHILLSYNIKSYLSELWERVPNFPLWFMIIARFLPFFPISTFLIIKSCSKSTAEKQGKIWWLAVRWGGWGVALVQVDLGGFWLVLDSFCRQRIILDSFRWFVILVVTSIAQHSEELPIYYTHGRTLLTEVIHLFFFSN